MKDAKAGPGGTSNEITRSVRRTARRAPKPRLKQAEIDRAIDDLARFGESAGKALLAEVLSARQHGHKY